jgi:peptidoglycan hydrolase CwlO-like protein
MKHQTVIIGLIIVFFLIFTVSNYSFVFAQDQTPTPTPDTSQSQKDLEEQIQSLRGKIAELKEKGKTLSSQIAIMDNQVRLTEAKVFATKQEISNFVLDIDITTNKITSLQEALDNLSEILLNRIVATYEAGMVKPFEILLSSNNASNYFSRLNYLEIAQSHDKRLIYDTQAAKNDYTNQKKIFEEKKKKVEILKKQLESYTVQLTQEKQSKQDLLIQTKGSESTYQQLLSQAQEQLAGFARFATTQGGPSILPPQPSPDGWYYNQRDERWGNNSIGLSGEPVWKYGCLLTSVAMILKQRGENIIPIDVAGNSSYFFQAYMLIPWAGGKFTSIWNKDLGTIDAKLTSGKPVIVGLYAGQYGTHFVVLKSGSNGDYVMNDPWYGPNLKFSDHYNTSQIFQYGFYNG